MNVYIIRHGQSEGNLQRRHCGWSQTPLSDLGHQQARQAGLLLKGISFDRVYSSDLLRARQTAEDALPGCRPILSDKLREVGVGSLAGRLISECASEYGAAYQEDIRRQDFSAYGGESQAEIAERMRLFAQELEQLRGVDTVAVFGHEGTVHQMLCYTLQADVLLEHLKISNSSISIFSYEHGIWRLIQWNYIAAL